MQQRSYKMKENVNIERLYKQETEEIKDVQFQS